MPEYFDKEKLSFKDIIFNTIQDIEKKALIEFRGGQKRTIIHGNWSESYTEPDSRKEFIQGVEFLYDLLHPMIKNKENYPPAYKEYFTTINKECDGADSKIKELLNDLEEQKITKEEYVVQKTRLMRSLFRTLILSLNVTNILKKSGGVG